MEAVDAAGAVGAEARGLAGRTARDYVHAVRGIDAVWADRLGAVFAEAGEADVVAVTRPAAAVHAGRRQVGTHLLAAAIQERAAVRLGEQNRFRHAVAHFRQPRGGIGRHDARSVAVYERTEREARGVGS